MFKRMITAAALLMMASPVLSQTITGNEFQTGQTGKTVVGTVMMCLDVTGTAVPASTGACANPIAVSGTFAPAANASTAINDGTTTSQKAAVNATGALLTRVDQTTPGTTNGVVVNSSALPTGASTSANQTTGNSSLASIVTNTANAGTPTLATASVTALTAPYPFGAIPITSSSGNQANTAAIATLAGAAGKTTYVCGFQVDGGGSTTAITVNPTVSGTVSGTLTYLYGVGVIAAGSLSPQLQVAFNPCIPASAANTAIVVTLPALGLGNLNAIAVTHGYQL